MLTACFSLHRRLRLLRRHSWGCCKTKKGQNVVMTFCPGQKVATTFYPGQTVVTIFVWDHISQQFFVPDQNIVTTFCPRQNVVTTFCLILVLQQPQELRRRDKMK